MRQRGFTLIEILVCISIIAVLAAILFVSLQPAKKSGRQTSCVSNMRQMYLATQMYRQDNDGHEPELGKRFTSIELGLPDFEHGDPYQVAVGFYEKYMPDKRIRRCPEFMAHAEGNPVFSNMMCTYGPGFWSDDKENRGPTEGTIKANNPLSFGNIIAGLGQRAAMWTCDAHNPTMPPITPGRLETQKVLMIRFDGSLTTKMVKPSDTYPYEPLVGLKS